MVSLSNNGESKVAIVSISHHRSILHIIVFSVAIKLPIGLIVTTTYPRGTVIRDIVLLQSDVSVLLIARAFKKYSVSNFNNGKI